MCTRDSEMRTIPQKDRMLLPSLRERPAGHDICQKQTLSMIPVDKTRQDNTRTMMPFLLLCHVGRDRGISISREQLIRAIL